MSKCKTKDHKSLPPRNRHKKGNEVNLKNLVWYEFEEENSDDPYRSIKLDGNDNLHFSHALRNARVPNHFMLPKIPKYKEKGDLSKYLKNFKTCMSLRGTLPALKCRAFHFKVTVTIEIWCRIPTESIKSWLDHKKAFLNQHLSSKDKKLPFDTFKNEVTSKTLKIYLVRFTDKMNYFEHVTIRKPISALKVGLNINTLFRRDERDKSPTIYDL